VSRQEQQQRLDRGSTMGVPTEVEELAWLVKDNLHTKHLVLSVEELFLEFLEPSYEGEPSLVLEPMLSYERMLLHRLADCFRLVHESVGEGDQRHLVIERSKDSIMYVFSLCLLSAC
jgi:hypothetical protein